MDEEIKYDESDFDAELPDLLEVDYQERKRLEEKIKYEFNDLLQERYFDGMKTLWEGGLYYEQIPLKIKDMLVYLQFEDLPRIYYEVNDLHNVLNQLDYNSWFTWNGKDFLTYVNSIYDVTKNSIVYNLIFGFDVKKFYDTDFKTLKPYLDKVFEWLLENQLEFDSKVFTMFFDNEIVGRSRTLSNEIFKYIKSFAPIVTFKKTDIRTKSIKPKIINPELLSEGYNNLLQTAFLDKDFILCSLILEYKSRYNLCLIDRIYDDLTKSQVEFLHRMWRRYQACNEFNYLMSIYKSSNKNLEYIGDLLNTLSKEQRVEFFQRLTH